MINDKVFLHFPVSFQQVCKLYPPTVNDVVGNEEFPRYQSLFTLSQEELMDENEKNDTIGTVPTPFQYLMIAYYGNEELKQIILDAFSFFIHEPVAIIPELKVVIIGKLEKDIDPDVDLVNPRLIN